MEGVITGGTVKFVTESKQPTNDDELGGSPSSADINSSFILKIPHNAEALLLSRKIC
jgi:hypothetical protein